MPDKFSTYHPIITFIYFVAVIILSVIVMDPVFMGISLICAGIYAVILKGARVLKFCFGLVVPLIVLSILINPLVNHRGMTILFELPFGLGAVTLESIIYGLTTGLMIGAVIMWFVSFNVVITSDKVIYLFGRILPSSSLIFVMILRFIPRYREQIKKISEAQQSLGMGINAGSLRIRIKNGARILSIMFTWALENAIQTADSMKSRGYGLRDRTSYMSYKFTASDKLLLAVMIILIAGVIGAMASGNMSTEFFPVFDSAFSGSGSDVSFMITGCICFTLLALIPAGIEMRDVFYWKRETKELCNDN